ncbi:MAG: cytidine deaminase [Dehalococcoidales bacterium]|jgi:cytidine deaminase
MTTIQDLIKAAHGVTGVYKPSKQVESGSVGAALLTKDGNVYTGVCIDTASSLGFCAEHSAIAEMLKHHESEIVMVAAVDTEGRPGTPCGRCREFLYQLNKANEDTKIILGPDKTITLKELLPMHWLDMWGRR